METKKILGLIFSLVFLGAFAFVLSWGIINFNKVKDGMSGTQLYTNEDLQKSYQDGYDTALKNKGEYDELINGYRDTITTLNDSISQLNSEINDLSRSNKDYQAQVSTLTAIKTQNEQTIESLESMVSDNGQMISSLNTEINRLNNTIKDLQDEVVIYQGTVDSKNSLITNLQGQIDIMQNDCVEYNNTINGLNNQISLLRANIEALENDAGNHDIEIANLNSQIQKLENDKQVIQSELAQKESTISSLNSQITMLQRENENITIEINSKNAEISTLNSQISSLQALVTQLQTTNELNLSTIASLNGQIASLNSQVSDLTLQIQANSSSVTALNDRIRELENSVAYYQNYIAGLESAETAVATFEFNGSVYNIQIVNKGSLVTVTQPTSTDYIIFNGWKVNGLAVDLSTYYVNENTKFVADITKRYDVCFMVDSQCMDNQIVEENHFAINKVTPIKEGYEFDGWTINNNIVDVESTQITANTTFVAKFTKLHTVKFVFEDSTIDTQTIRNGSNAISPVITNTTYKVFNGWKLNASFVDINTYTITNDTTFTADITYKYDVVFKVGDTQHNAQIVSAGQYPILPETPEKAGYEFDGWTLNGRDVVNPLTLSISANTTYIAKFTKLYTATFVYEGQTISTQSIRSGSSPINVNVADTTHTVFNGWKLNNSIVNITTYKMNSDTTFVADITYKYDVVFSNDGATYNSQIVANGSTATVPANPTKNGYDFDGWMLNGVVVDVSSIAITENTTFNAKYTKLHNVAFVYEGTTISSQTIRDGAKAKLPSVANTSYKVLNGWKVGDEIVNVTTFTIANDVTFVADITYKFDVVFKVDNLTHNSQIVTANGTATLPETPTKAGYEFDGWSIDGKTISNVLTTKITKNTTFTAIFTKLHTVTFVYEGSTISTQTIRNNSKAGAPAVSSTDYKVFNGWKVGNSFVDTTTYSITGNTTFIADITYKYDVVFKVDGANYNSQIVATNNHATVPTAPKKANYKFTGWALNGQVVDVNSISITGNTTFVAQFVMTVVPKGAYCFSMDFVSDGWSIYPGAQLIIEFDANGNVKTCEEVNYTSSGNFTCEAYNTSNSCIKVVMRSNGIYDNDYYEFDLIYDCDNGTWSVQNIDCQDMYGAVEIRNFRYEFFTVIEVESALQDPFGYYKYYIPLPNGTTLEGIVVYGDNKVFCMSCGYAEIISFSLSKEYDFTYVTVTQKDYNTTYTIEFSYWYGFSVSQVTSSDGGSWDGWDLNAVYCDKHYLGWGY